MLTHLLFSVRPQRLWSVVLVLAGIKLIFFTVASMRLFWICPENSVDNTGMF